MRFSLDHRGLDRKLRDAGTRAMLEGAASIVVDAVEDRAPRVTGEFAGSIVKTGVEPIGGDIGITVYSTDWAAHLVEFGSANNPAYAPFRRAASALGLKLRGEGRRR